MQAQLVEALAHAQQRVDDCELRLQFCQDDAQREAILKDLRYAQKLLLIWEERVHYGK